MARLDIRAILAKHPRPHLHYSDNGCWTLYRDKESSEKDDGALSKREKNVYEVIARGPRNDVDAEAMRIVRAPCWPRFLSIVASSVRRWQSLTLCLLQFRRKYENRCREQEHRYV